MSTTLWNLLFPYLKGDEIGEAEWLKIVLPLHLVLKLWTEIIKIIKQTTYNFSHTLVLLSHSILFRQEVVTLLRNIKQRFLFKRYKVAKLVCCTGGIWQYLGVRVERNCKIFSVSKTEIWITQECLKRNF